MNLEIAPLDGIHGGVRVRGEIDMESVDQLTEFIARLRPGSSPVVIDASGIEFMDSTGLRLLLSLAAADGAGGVVVRNPSRPVRRLLEVSVPDGMDGLTVEFDGAGPGAAHRFSELMRSTGELHRLAQMQRRRSAALRSDVRRARKHTA